MSDKLWMGDMAIVAAYRDVPPERIIRNRGNDADHPSADVYPLIGAPKDRSPGPNAFLVRYIPGATSSAHFHAADQMQIVVEGKGQLGHHRLRPYAIHFSRAYTPYGPLSPDAAEGWAFVNLRTRPDPNGAQRLPGARDTLLRVSDRRPFQATFTVAFPDIAGGSAMAPIAGMNSDEGLHGIARSMAPGTRWAAPSPAHSDGQYIVVVAGGLMHEGRRYDALCVVFVRADEEPFVIEAGPAGLQAMILNFPRVREAQAEPVAPKVASKVWQCLLCGFAYDEAAGMPHDGIPPGTPWASVPEDWSCPDCGAQKSDFQMVEM